MRSIPLLFAFLSLALVGALEAKAKNETVAEQVGPYLVFDDQVLDILDLEATVETLADGFVWTEGPLWLKSQQCLLFSDIPNKKVMRYCPESGVDTYLSDSGFSNGLILDKSGKLVLMQSRSRRIARMNAALAKPEPNYESLASHYKSKRLNSPNDVTINHKGDLYFTDPAYGLPEQLEDPDKELRFQGVFRLSTNGELTLLDKTLSHPNGITLINDGTQLIVAVSDPDNPAWYIYNVTKGGLLADRRLFASTKDYSFKRDPEGLPDGLKQHDNGTVFASGPGGVWLFNPQGKLLAHLPIKGPVSNLAFNESQQALYLTAESKLLRVKLRRRQPTAYNAEKN